jgi:hypothetical protein
MEIFFGEHTILGQEDELCPERTDRNTTAPVTKRTEKQSGNNSSYTTNETGSDSKPKNDGTTGRRN